MIRWIKCNRLHWGDEMLKDFFENNAPKNKELKNLYYLIHKEGPMTSAVIIEKTAIKKTTLVRMLDELIKDKFIKENGFGESAVGRPPILYGVEPVYSYIIGVHISRMKTNIVLLDLQFRQVDQESFVMTTMHTPEFVVMKIRSVINRFMVKHQFDNDRLLGIGLASIGPLDQQEGMILEPESFLSGNWCHVPIVQMIREHFPIRILFEKGANAAAIAELESAKGLYKNILYCISGGWGMDCGVINDGLILQERFADAKGYGHMIIDLDGKECTCGNRGCLLAYTSFKSILHELKNENALLSQMDDEVFQKATLTDMMEYFKQGDALTEKVILQSARYLGVALSNLIRIFQPEKVILNGPFIYEIDQYCEETVQQTKAQLSGNYDVVFSQGELKENAAAIGAGILLFNSYFDK